jgi:hypothetical protein
MMEAVRISQTPDANHFTRQYIPEDNSEHHTRRRENLKSHKFFKVWVSFYSGQPVSYVSVSSLHA